MFKCSSLQKSELNVCIRKILGKERLLKKDKKRIRPLGTIRGLKLVIHGYIRVQIAAAHCLIVNISKVIVYRHNQVNSNASNKLLKHYIEFEIDLNAIAVVFSYQVQTGL